MIRESAAGPTVAEPATTGAAAAEVAAPGAAAGTVATGAAAAGAACWAWAIEAPNAASKAAINRELRVMMCAFDEVLDGAVQPSRIGRGTIIAKPYVATANMHTPLHQTGRRGQHASAAAMRRAIRRKPHRVRGGGAAVSPAALRRRPCREPMRRRLLCGGRLGRVERWRGQVRAG